MAVEQVFADAALTHSDSIFVTLLIGVASFCFWLIRYVFKKNDEREKRFIDVIETQAEGLKRLERIDDNISKLMDIHLRREDSDKTGGG